MSRVFLYIVMLALPLLPAGLTYSAFTEYLADRSRADQFFAHGDLVYAAIFALFTLIALAGTAAFLESPPR